jgi:hypothetical protein
VPLSSAGRQRAATGIGSSNPTEQQSCAQVSTAHFSVLATCRPPCCHVCVSVQQHSLSVERTSESGNGLLSADPAVQELLDEVSSKAQPVDCILLFEAVSGSSAGHSSPAAASQHRQSIPSRTPGC